MSIERDIVPAPGRGVASDGGVDRSDGEAAALRGKETALLVAYDFLKHMSTLALVAVGGMLGLAQGIGARPSGAILASVAIIGIGGFISLTFMTGIAATQIRQRVHKSSNALALAIVMVVLMLFAVGLGAFIAGFLDALAHA